jgi:hypothetical protein
VNDLEISGYGDQRLWAGESGPSLIDIELQDVNAIAAITLDFTEAVELADWLEAWIKTQQDAYAADDSAANATNDKPPVQELLSDSEFWSTLSDAEQQQVRDIASQLDAATGMCGTSLSAIVAAMNPTRKVQP